MKALANREFYKTILLILLVLFFSIFYWETVMSLPLFGDATIHGYQANILRDKNWSSLTAEYPSLYYFAMSVVYSQIGEIGYNLLIYVGFILLLISTFLLVKEFTKNYYLALLSLVLVACSPKIIFYSARMYQEVLISAFFIFVIYLLFKFLRVKSNKIFAILILFLGITISFKQQGLFILYPSIVFLFIVELIRKKVAFVQLLLIILIPLFIALPFYGVLFHTKGELQPGSGEFKPLKIVNNIGQSVFMYKENIAQNSNTKIDNSILNKPTTNLQNDIENNKLSLDSKLIMIEKSHLSLGSTRAENRHLWPTEIFTNFDKFNQANNLYTSTQGEDLESKVPMLITFTLLIFGFLYCLFNLKSYSSLIIFSLAFLTINYLAFMRNTDQQRYHMYLPIFLLVFVFIFFNIILKKTKIKKILSLITIFTLLIMIYIPLLTSRIVINKSWANSQLYSSSVGGIQSVAEMGKWLNINSDNNTIIGQQCGNETQYYSNRIIKGDWRIYFLDEVSLIEYFKEKNIKYYIIFDSQLVNDNDWHSLCWVPYSFNEKLKRNYKLVYETKAKDIRIYETN